jgi:molecular chaperone DnaK
VAEAALGAPVDRAVITVPANFNDLQRAATKTAGKLAGLEVVRILNEPTAAALAYGPPARSRETVAVYDLGGGTFDVTLLDLAGNVFEVLATAGDTALGGDDIDIIVAELMAEQLLKEHRFDARSSGLAFGQLRLLAERLKRELSTNEEHTLAGDDLVPGDRGSAVKWQYRMARSDLEWASQSVIDRTFAVCQQALDVAGVQASDLDRVLLVGGATRMPMVMRQVEQFFGRAPTVRINPEEVVALGAAIQASLLDRTRRKRAVPSAHPRIDASSVVHPSHEALAADELPILPVVHPHDEGAARASQVEFLRGVSSRPRLFEVPGSGTVPAYDSAPTFELELPLPEPRTAAQPPPVPSKRTLGIKPPAPLGSQPSREASQPGGREPPPLQVALAPLLIDVTPLSLGVETVGGFCDILIEANTPVPCDRTRSFATASDGQTAVRVRVAQGASKRFEENTFLGEVELSDLTAAPRGETQIAVIFEIDADGILNVRARDIKTGHETAARIRLVGAQTGPGDLEAMQARQAAHPVAL